MEILQNISVLDVVVVVLLTTLTALAAYWGKAVFHDGIRPILPEVLEGRMKRTELVSISYGLSIGFILSVGLSFAISFKLLNPWLLFLPTDILGVLATRWWMAAGLGGIWGAVALFGLSGVQSVLNILPIDLLGALGELSTPVLVAFTTFPIIAILHQFGWVRALISGIIVLMVRQLLSAVGGVLTDKAESNLEKARQLTEVLFPKDADFIGKINALKEAAGQNQQVLDLISQANNQFSLGSTIGGFTMQIAVMMLMGMILLVIFAIIKDYKNKVNITVDTEEDTIFAASTKRIYKGLPILAGIGALIAMAANLGLMTGSEVSGPILQQAWNTTGQEQSDLLQSAAIADIIRGISFIPLIVTTALATGVYGVVGLTFVFPIGYLLPNPFLAGIVGALWIYLEVIAYRGIGRFLQRYPSLRDCSDNIRSSMNSLIELALFIGGAFAAMKMAPEAVGLSLTIYILLYAANEGLGRPIMKLAAGPVAIILTGMVLNLLYFLQLV